ncbi:hypothetical protein Micbo1qcDRAFT_195695 [Microdochium bolleyi]|uniref:DUF1772-domain-containing protein n=1 Tax=Microdochium bolleyi TaxID=196109 RepID=A0A136J178_9PEZI|nr:hypothetical protein Micbo1qcDRAFT_195695 [Microdochium bolleyi]
MASALDRNPTLAAAQLVGLSAPVFLAGAQVGLSQLAIPPLLNTPQSYSTPAFAHIYRAGARLAVPLSLVGLLSSSLAAYLSHGYPYTPYTTALVSQRTAWAAAALACAGVPIFTRLVMTSDIKPLLERADGFASGARTTEKHVTPADDAKVQGWLRSWRRLNLVRAGIMAVAATFAGYAIVTQAF